MIRKEKSKKAKRCQCNGINPSHSKILGLAAESLLNISKLS